MNIKTQKTLSVVLSIVGSVGVVATAFLAAKRAPKAEKELKKASDKKEKAAIFVKNYWPVIVSATATVASITAGTIISKKTEASLTAMAVGADQLYRRYKGKAIELFGDKAKDITKEVSKDLFDSKKIAKLPKKEGERLYYEEHVGFFYASPEDIAYAIGDINKRLATQDCISPFKTFYWASLRTFLYDANVNKFYGGSLKEGCKEDGSDVDDMSFDYGWDKEYLNHMYGCSNIDAHFLDVLDDDGETKYTMISFDQEPVADIGETSKNYIDASNYDQYYTGLEGTSELFVPSNPRSKLRDAGENDGVVYEEDIKEKIKDE